MAKFDLIILLAWFSSVVTEPYIDPLDCPLQCSCQRYTIECKHATVFPENLPEVTHEFRLSDSQIDAIPSNVFLNLNWLTSINITNVKINKVMACAFAELGGVQIRFEGVDVEVMESNSFSNIVNSSEIVISRSNIQEMKSFAFHNLKDIDFIDIANTNIGTVHPYAFRHIENVTEFSMVNCSVDRLLKEAFSRFYHVEFTYILRSTIKEWQCGSVSLGLHSGEHLMVSDSSLTCACSLAWLWKKHPSSTIIHEASNRCYGSNFMLEELEVKDICESEEKQMIGCPQLLPSTPHTCSRMFDAPYEPEQKVEYPKYFSKDPQGENSASVQLTSLVLIVSGLFIASHSYSCC